MTDSFHRTLIVGASVSAAPTERNPSKRFLLSQGYLNGVISHAFSGTPGARILSQLKKSLLEEASAVLAVDLMFWDSVFGLADPRESQAFLRGFFKEVKKLKLPIVIGTIPLIHGLQVHREVLNEAIRKEAEAYEKARILDLAGLYDSARREGIQVGAKTYSLSELAPDGLHPGPIAAEAIAQRIHQTITGRAEFDGHIEGEAKSC